MARFSSWARCATLILGTAVFSPDAAGHGQSPVEVAQSPATDGEQTPPARWRFRDPKRPVKVVVLAGSIGAFPRWSYADRLQGWCSAIEVHNLSASGLGAWALKTRFREQVLENRRVRPSVPGEFWLLFGGGLNSVGAPERTNRWVRDLFVMAHGTGLRVIGLTVTPWGDETDRRWRGASGLRYWDASRKVADFILGRLTPRQALGREVRRRAEPEAPWQATELADIGIDLYDSALRHSDAQPRDVDAMTSALESDAQWRRDHLDWDARRRARALQEDAQRAAEIPRWYLRPELRGFDHIHPNREGHLVMATVICPQLPSSWRCVCPPGR